MAKSIGPKGGGRLVSVKGRSDYLTGVAGNWVKRDVPSFGISTKPPQSSAPGRASSSREYVKLNKNT